MGLAGWGRVLWLDLSLVHGGPAVRGSWMTIFMVVYQMGKLRSYIRLGRSSPARCLGVREGPGPGPGLACRGSVLPCLASSREGWGSSVCTVPRAMQPRGGRDQDLSMQEGSGHIPWSPLWTPLHQASPHPPVFWLGSVLRDRCSRDLAQVTSNSREGLGLHSAGDQLPTRLLWCADDHRPRRAAP